MKFSIAVNMERGHPDQDMRQVARNALELVRMAEQGQFEIAWAAEHHAIELTIGPNPFTILTHWAAHTSRIRLGTAVVVAHYWHPIRLAGEAALFDIFSDGRLELGLGRGAFQYEFDRMAGGIEQRQGGAYLREILPVVLALWRGDTEHRGERWQFPLATSVPKPLQRPHPPIWVAARDPDTCAWGHRIGANILATPLSRPHAEVGILGRRFDETMAKFPDHPRPRFLMLRGSVYRHPEDWRVPVEASIAHDGEFDSLFQNVGGVTNGFVTPEQPNTAKSRGDERASMVLDRMVFGTPDQVIARLDKSMRQPASISSATVCLSGCRTPPPVGRWNYSSLM